MTAATDYADSALACYYAYIAAVKECEHPLARQAFSIPSIHGVTPHPPFYAMPDRPEWVVSQQNVSADIGRNP